MMKLFVALSAAMPSVLAKASPLDGCYHVFVDAGANMRRARYAP